MIGAPGRPGQQQEHSQPGHTDERASHDHPVQPLVHEHRTEERRERQRADQQRLHQQQRAEAQSDHLQTQSRDRGADPHQPHRSPDQAYQERRTQRPARRHLMGRASLCRARQPHTRSTHDRGRHGHHQRHPRRVHATSSLAYRCHTSPSRPPTGPPAVTLRALQRLRRAVFAAIDWPPSVSGTLPVGTSDVKHTSKQRNTDGDGFSSPTTYSSLLTCGSWVSPRSRPTRPPPRVRQRTWTSHVCRVHCLHPPPAARNSSPTDRHPRKGPLITCHNT